MKLISSYRWTTLIKNLWTWFWIRLNFTSSTTCRCLCAKDIVFLVAWVAILSLCAQNILMLAKIASFSTVGSEVTLELNSRELAQCWPTRQSTMFCASLIQTFWKWTNHLERSWPMKILLDSMRIRPFSIWDSGKSLCTFLSRNSLCTSVWNSSISQIFTWFRELM